MLAIAKNSWLDLSVQPLLRNEFLGSRKNLNELETIKISLQEKVI